MLAILLLIIFVSANLKTELKEEVKPKLAEAEEKVGGIKSKVMLNINFVSLSLLLLAWHHMVNFKRFC
jgi:hypothetical protein